MDLGVLASPRVVDPTAANTALVEAGQTVRMEGATLALAPRWRWRRASPLSPRRCRPCLPIPPRADVPKVLSIAAAMVLTLGSRLVVVVGLPLMISLRLLLHGEPRHSPPRPVMETDAERSRPRASESGKGEPGPEG